MINLGLCGIDSGFLLSQEWKEGKVTVKFRQGGIVRFGIPHPDSYRDAESRNNISVTLIIFVSI